MKNSRRYFIWLLIIGFFTNSCVESFDIKSITFESALVVEATITNELKHQEINLSRTFKLDENGPSSESNASVKIIDDLKNNYDFEETKPGKYISTIEFSAKPDRLYQLIITTNDGKSYSSENVQLTNTSQIENVYAKKETDVVGNEGISIYVNSFNPLGNSRYYRYEYEGTYKVIAPKWSLYDLVVRTDVDTLAFELVPKTKQVKICYNTIYSKGILQTETNNLIEDRVSKFHIQFISGDNFLISHRYSILVKQYVQSHEAFAFYRTLNDLSGSESILSQNQPGFINGNVFSADNANEKVIGFFEVSSVSSKRIFINRDDFDLIDYTSPPYEAECEDIAPPLNQLLETIQSGNLIFYNNNIGIPRLPGGPYVMVPSKCGDCTKIGTNIVPDFWEE